MGKGRYWLHTLGCPKNQVDSEKLAGTLAADGYRPAARPRGRRPGRGEHLCLHRGGPPGVDRGRARAGRGRRPGPAWSSPVAWPSATATNWPTPCPRSTWWPASACRSTSAAPGHSVRASATGRAGRGRSIVRPAGAAPARRRRPVGVPQGGRGLRPASAGSAPSRPSAGPQRSRTTRRPAGRGRSAGRRSDRGPRDGAGRPGPGLLRPGPLDWSGPPAGRRGGRRPIVDWSRRWRALVDPDPAALSLSVGAHRRAGGGRARHRGSLLRPLAPARLAALLRGCAAGVTATGSSTGSPRSGRPSPGHLPLVVHPRLPG